MTNNYILLTPEFRDKLLPFVNVTPESAELYVTLKQLPSHSITFNNEVTPVAETEKSIEPEIIESKESEVENSTPEFNPIA